MSLASFLRGLDGPVRQAPRIAVQGPAAFWRPENVFPALLALFGLAFALIIPPLQAPDEVGYFLRAYHLSEGNLTLPIQDGWGGDETPDSVLAVIAAYAPLAFHPEIKALPADFARLWSAPLAPQRRSHASFGIANVYTIVPFIPSACGVAVARLAGGNALMLLYAGRLANLTLAVVLLALTLRVSPYFKQLLGVLALTPVAVQQFASLSVDSCALGLAFLLFALLCRLAVGGPARVGWRTVAGLYLLVAALAFCKFPYAFLALLYLGVPARRFASRARYAWAGAGLLLVLFGAAAVAAAATRQGIPAVHHQPGWLVDPSAQIHGICSRPLHFIRICCHSIVRDGLTWLQTAGCLGWLDAPLDGRVMTVDLALVLALGLLDPSGEMGPTLRLRLAALLAAGVMVGLILTAVYVSWSPPGSDLVVGVQGRYFFAATPALLLSVNLRPALRRYAGALSGLTAAVCVAVLLAALVTILRRYYFTASPGWLSLRGAIAVAALLACVGAALAHRARFVSGRAAETAGADACKKAA